MPIAAPARPAICAGVGIGMRCVGDEIVRPRTEEDLDALTIMAAEVQQRDGYPVRFSLDLRAFVETPDAHAASLTATRAANDVFR